MFLYIIRSGNRVDSPVKVGVAKNVEQRVYDMQTGNPEELIILYKICMNSRRHAYMVENKIHKKYDHYNIRGEWFNCRILNTLKIKELVDERESEKNFNEDDHAMVAEANKHI